MSGRHVDFGWLDLDASGAEREGVVSDGTGLALGTPAGQRDYHDPFGDSGPRDYDYGFWVSPTLPAAFPATSIVASWAAETPGTSWVGIGIRGRTASDASWSRWFVIARWAATDDEIHPTSVPGQSADGIAVETDELLIEPDEAWESYQVRVILFRLVGTDDRPRLTRLGLMTSAVPRGRKADLPPTSAPILPDAIQLDVSTYSQQLHRDNYPAYDGGGQSWCSPTSIAMVLDHWDRLPPPHDYAWVEPQQSDRFVPYIARACFDHAFGGAGNWAFNTAYASTRNLVAFVTRLRSLAEAEAFIGAGIPLIISLAFEEDELTGAGYDTKGHLMVLIGFTQEGDPIVNDPASHRIESDAAVRTTYRRDQIEALWLRSSGGVVYVIHPLEFPLPPHPPERNW
ncbi:MAG TPA: C39 family peptidase [Nocardioidaceae bacterium]|nr:C39 family peptidase [Nocardioidaceae bacterium]